VPTKVKSPAARNSDRSASGAAARGKAAAQHNFGAHLSIAGGMYHALESAERLGFDAVQVFVKNQRQWKAGPLRADDLDRWFKTRARVGLRTAPIAHATYLINLAAHDPIIAQKSRDAFAEELIRCDAFEIPYLVIHPGAAVGAPVAEALLRVSKTIDAIFEKYPKLRAMPLLETTAGQGSCLGCTFEQLGQIIDAVQEPRRVGVCIDTCHVFSTGHDIRTSDGYQRMIAQAAKHVGLKKIRAWHFNDSKTPLNSRVDRHAHIGLGQIGDAGFANVLADERFAGLPMLLETPKEKDHPQGREWDAVNFARLRAIARKAPR
jgi:deoxyribonuclease IV